MKKCVESAVESLVRQKSQRMRHLKVMEKGVIMEVVYEQWNKSIVAS